MVENFKKSVMVEFEMTDLGLMHYFFYIEVKQSVVLKINICEKF